MSRIAESSYGDTPAPYPKSPGWTEPSTSRDAALKIRQRATSLRAATLTAIAGSPTGMTADEVASALNNSVLGIRPRITELKQMSKIERTGERRTNASGLKAAVWRLKR